MIKCEPFCGKPGSGVAGCQPFEMKMHSNVLVAMDFHAHLMTTEVIGFLAGKWNKEERSKYLGIGGVVYMCVCQRESNTLISNIRHGSSSSLSMSLLEYGTK
jgi:hypothetical protein